MFAILSLAVESFSLPMQWTSNDKKLYNNDDNIDICKLLVELQFAFQGNFCESKYVYMVLMSACVYKLLVVCATRPLISWYDNAFPDEIVLRSITEPLDHTMPCL